MNNQASKTNIDLFENLPVPKAVRIMAVPTILGQLIVLFYSMADTFFLGQTNNPQMVAAASLILPIFNITLSLAGLAGVGGGALISRLLGIKDFDEARKVSSFSIYFGILISGLFSILVFLFIKPLMFALGADSETFVFAKDYAIWVIVFWWHSNGSFKCIVFLVKKCRGIKKSGFWCNDGWNH